MTDNDIIKAFDEAINLDSIRICVALSFLDKPGNTKNEYISLATIRDILNRQKEELDRCHKRLHELEFLQRRVNSIKNTSKDTFLGSILTLADSVATYEALQDFSDALKIKFPNDPETYTGVFYGPQSIHDKINDLLKEKVGDDSGNLQKKG